MSESTRPILSVCIPTCKRADILKTTLQSIYSSNIDCHLFEVCISDNSDTDETESLIAAEFSHIENLRYQHSSCQGFLNSLEALKMGQGHLLKLHNDYSSFSEGALSAMVETVTQYSVIRPLLFFSMGVLHLDPPSREFSSFDAFMDCVSYYATWSTSFSLWREDLDSLLSVGKLEPDIMFPHTDLLFQLPEKNLYVVDDSCYANSQTVPKKRGYNLPDTFVRIYLTMLESLLEAGHISPETFDKQKDGILEFTARWFFVTRCNPDLYSYDFSRMFSTVWKQCGFSGLLRFCRWLVRCRREFPRGRKKQ